MSCERHINITRIKSRMSDRGKKGKSRGKSNSLSIPPRTLIVQLTLLYHSDCVSQKGYFTWQTYSLIPTVKWDIFRIVFNLADHFSLMYVKRLRHLLKTKALKEANHLTGIALSVKFN